MLTEFYEDDILSDDVNNLDTNILIEYMKNKFDISVSHPNSLILTSMFYDYLEYLSNKHINEKIYVIPFEKLYKNHNVDKNIIDYAIRIMKDLNSRIQANYNIIGGKVVDMLNGVSFEDSVGDFDIWVTGSGINELFTQQDALYDYIKNNYVLDEEKSRHDCITFYDKKEKNITINLQIIFGKNFVNVNDIFSKFDFLHCCVGIDSKNLFWRQGALKSIKQKNIIVNGLYPSRVLHERLIKYINRGYKINYPNFILCSLSVLFGVFNSPSIPSSLVANSPYDDPVWLRYRSSNSYEELTNINL
jgi:hypothetical protein